MGPKRRVWRTHAQPRFFDLQNEGVAARDSAVDELLVAIQRPPRGRPATGCRRVHRHHSIPAEAGLLREIRPTQEARTYVCGRRHRDSRQLARAGRGRRRPGGGDAWDSPSRRQGHFTQPSRPCGSMRSLRRLACQVDRLPGQQPPDNAARARARRRRAAYIPPAEPKPIPFGPWRQHQGGSVATVGGLQGRLPVRRTPLHPPQLAGIPAWTELPLCAGRRGRRRGFPFDGQLRERRLSGVHAHEHVWALWNAGSWSHKERPADCHATNVAVPDLPPECGGHQPRTERTRASSSLPSTLLRSDKSSQHFQHGFPRATVPSAPPPATQEGLGKFLERDVEGRGCCRLPTRGKA